MARASSSPTSTRACATRNISLVGKYRGNNGGGSYTHNYNWYDPYNHSATPRTLHPHGSHTMGTMLGDDGAANRTGFAPDAKWMACIGFGAGGGTGATDAGLLECGQFALAPSMTAGGSPDPSRHADVVHNSWGHCGQSYDSWYEGVINGWIAAGMVPIFSHGNASNCFYPSKPPLDTIGNPARSGKVLGIGSTGKDNGLYAPHSNKGPTDDPNQQWHVDVGAACSGCRRADVECGALPQWELPGHGHVPPQRDR